MQKLFLQTRQLIHVITEMICYFRYQNFSKAYRLSARVMVLFQEMMEALVEEGMEDIAENFLPVLQAALEASESQDGMRIADLFEAGILPDLMHLQQGVFGAADDILCDFWGKNRQYIKEKNPELYRRILEARENISDDYQINWAETGDIVLSMETETGTVRTNSLINPWREAILYASKTISCEDDEYIVVGFGLGYHIEQIIKQSYGQKVTVLEQDINQLAIAFSYRDLSELLQKDNLNLIFASDIDVYTEYMARMSENGKVCIWDASVKSIVNTELKEFLENQQIERASIENQKGFLFYNFCQNILLKDKEVSSLKEKFAGKTMLLIAGGPSLDAAIETLRTMDRQDIVTVCVGKVVKKLVKLGILPDYIVMIDAQPSTRWQTRDIERCGVPLIYLSTTASSVVSSYEGERYIAYQEGLKMAEKKAEEEGITLYQTGGSVATFALDMGIRLGCARILCLGTDMGYPDGKTHAEGVGRSVASEEALRQVEGILTPFVHTSRTLDIYRQWIENRVRQEKKVEFINASKGARIHGMKEMELSEYLSR